MPAAWKRTRGVLLRLVRARAIAVALGALLLGSAILLAIRDAPWESWATDGLALVGGATGTALLLAGLGGLRPDWIEPGAGAPPRRRDRS